MAAPMTFSMQAKPMMFMSPLRTFANIDYNAINKENSVAKAYN